MALPCPEKTKAALMEAREREGDRQLGLFSWLQRKESPPPLLQVYVRIIIVVRTVKSCGLRKNASQCAVRML